MTKYYNFNSKIKKQMLSKWIKSQKKYKKGRIIANIFYAIASIICIGCCVFITTQSNDVGQHMALSFTAIGLLVGCFFASIPFAIGQVIINKCKREYGRPYCRMTREFLYTDDEGIQFGYHSTENKYTASMDVYQILYEDINRVDFDEVYNIVTIMGCGELIAYDDYTTKRVNRRLSERKFYSDSCYSFILAFDDKKEFLELINNRKNRKD